MVNHSSVLAWRIPGTGEPGGLPSMGSHSWTRLKGPSSSSSSRALLCCWDGHIFFHQFLVVPEYPTPLLGRYILTKLGTTLLMGSFTAPRTLQLLVTTEEPITPSPIERDQKLWEDKINHQVWDQGIPGRAHQAEPVITVL